MYGHSPSPANIEKPLGSRRQLCGMALLHEQILRGRGYIDHSRTRKEKLYPANIPSRGSYHMWMGNSAVRVPIGCHRRGFKLGNPYIDGNLIFPIEDPLTPS